MLNTEQKNSIILDHQSSSSDTGSSAVQIALLTARIIDLQKHFKKHKQDFHSKYGLLGLVSKRRRLLNYLKNEDVNRYRNLINKLDLRR